MTKQAKGVYSTLKMAYETEYGKDPTDLATKAYQLPFNTNGLKGTQNSTDSKTMRGRRDPDEPIMGFIDVSGDLVGPVGATAIGHMLKMMYGAPTTTAGTVDGTYQHVFKISEEQPSVVLEVGHPDIGVYRKYNGVKASKLAMTVGGDGELVITESLMGTNEVVGTTSMNTAPTSVVIDRFNNFQASLKMGGTVLADVTELSMNVDGGMDGDTYCIGSKGYRTAVNEGIISLSGQLTAMFKDSSYLTLAENNTTTSLELTLTKGDFSLAFKLPELQFARNTPAVDGPAGIKQQLTYHAFYAAASEATSMMVTLVNKTASY